MLLMPWLAVISVLLLGGALALMAFAISQAPRMRATARLVGRSRRMSRPQVRAWLAARRRHG